MSSALQPLKLYGLAATNPPKVAFVLEELGLPYEVVPVSVSLSIAKEPTYVPPPSTPPPSHHSHLLYPQHATVKDPSFLAINPNGRMPALRDPNNADLTIWESGAILQYLISRYDSTTQKLSFPPESALAWHATQYLFFQVSGQGPYYGNGYFFAKLSQPRNDAAVARFVAEAERVTGVLEGVLNAAPADANGNKWLVGGKCSYADLAFLPYQLIARVVFKDEGFHEGGQFPTVKRWVDVMLGRESVRKILMMTEPWPQMGLYA